MLPAVEGNAGIFRLGFAAWELAAWDDAGMRTLAMMAVMFGVTLGIGAETPGQALAKALAGTAASGVVVDWKTGAMVARVGEDVRAVPGSVVKPLVLEWALQHGVVRAETTVYCRRNLRVGTRELRCTHPADEPMMDAEMAIAESCNTWFAELGKRYTGVGLEEAFGAAGVRHLPLRGATVEQRELAVLGLEGVSVTLMELAKAYRGMLVRMKGEDAVSRGMRDSVKFGMARGAGVPGMDVMGKTGTAAEPGQVVTHGWFAGAVPGRFVVVVFVPHGDGGVASGLGRKFLEGVR